MGKASRGGPGLLGVVAIAGALTFTDVGGLVLGRMQMMSAQCNGVMPRGTGAIGGKFCLVVASAVRGVESVATFVGNSVGGLRGVRQSVENELPRVGSGRFTLGPSAQRAWMSLASSTDQLNAMLLAGPGNIRGTNLSQQLQQAVDSFTIGQHLRASGNATQAMPWMRQGAAQPNGFGLQSQLSLADMYRTSTAGVGADNRRAAERYYREALQSLNQLSVSSTPEAKQVLDALPLPVDQMKQQISQAILATRSGK